MPAHPGLVVFGTTLLNTNLGAARVLQLQIQGHKKNILLKIFFKFKVYRHTF